MSMKSTLRKGLALAGATATTAGLLALSAPANAAVDPGTYEVTITANYTVVDDDWDYDPFVTGQISRTYYVSPAHPEEWSYPGNRTKCAGGEVEGQMTPNIWAPGATPPPLVSPFPKGVVTVKLYFELFESDSCANFDKDGHRFSGYEYTSPGGSRTGTFTVPMKYETGDDSVTFAYRISVKKIA